MSRLENIQNSFKSIQAKTKAFFHGDRWKEVLVFFFFALLAFGFWLLQSLQQEYEIELVFPVKYKNVPADIAFNAPEVETITAKVKDKTGFQKNMSSTEWTYHMTISNQTGETLVAHNEERNWGIWYLV